MQTVKRATYLLLGLPLGTAWFCLFATLLSTGIGLAITLIGIPILVGTLYVIRPLAEFERFLVEHLLGVRARGTYRQAEREGRWPAIQARLADPQTWKDLAYLTAQFPLGILTFTIVVTVGAGALYTLLAPLYFWAIPGGIEVGLFDADTLPEALVLMVAGVPLTWLAIKVVDLVGVAQGHWARLLLESTPDPELTAQVDDARHAQARIVEAADAERRRLERDLHDGAQQRLVALSLKLGLAKARLANGGDGVEELVDEAHAESKAAVAELRDLARGIHPAILTDRGLGPALEELAGRSAVPADVLGTPAGRLPASVEATAYFVAAEALANVAKYAEASHVSVRATEELGRLVVEVVDDGRGGADAAHGTGLRGLADRVGALGGTLDVQSPAGHGTRVRAELPVTVPATPA